MLIRTENWTLPALVFLAMLVANGNAIVGTPRAASAKKTPETVYAQIGPKAKTATCANIFSAKDAVVTGSSGAAHKCSRQTPAFCPLSSRPTH